MARIHIYDTTLRDGSQGEGVNFSLQDKLLITRRLDDLGVDFIEGGYPLSNPKDFEYFQEVRNLPLRHARVVAFGMTRRKGVGAADDTCIRALLEGMQLEVAYYNDEPITVDLPVTVDLTVTYTEPGFKGDTATGGTKPATLETGLVVQVPLFVATGDKIRVKTDTGTYVERVA